MKTNILLLLCGFTLNLFCQEQNVFEQRAFEFYKDSVIKDLSSDRKIKICLKIQDYNYWESDCTIKFGLVWQDTMLGRYNANIRKISLEKDKRFRKVRNFRKGNYPITFVTPCIKTEENRNFVSVIETKKNDVISYTFEFDDNGKLKRWCKGKWIGE